MNAKVNGCLHAECTHESQRDECRLFRMMAEGSPPKDWRDYCTKEGKERVKRMSMDEYEKHLNK